MRLNLISKILITFFIILIALFAIQNLSMLLPKEAIVSGLMLEVVIENMDNYLNF